MIFHGPRGSVSAILVGSQLLDFTLNGFSPCPGVLTGSATVTLATRRIQAMYAGSDCQGTHSNGVSDVSPGTRQLKDFSGAWRSVVNGAFTAEVFQIRQSGTRVDMTYGTADATQFGLVSRVLSEA